MKWTRGEWGAIDDAWVMVDGDLSAGVYHVEGTDDWPAYWVWEVYKDGAEYVTKCGESTTMPGARRAAVAALKAAR